MRAVLRVFDLLITANVALRMLAKSRRPTDDVLVTFVRQRFRLGETAHFACVHRFACLGCRCNARYFNVKFVRRAVGNLVGMLACSGVPVFGVRFAPLRSECMSVRVGRNIVASDKPKHSHHNHNRKKHR